MNDYWNGRFSKEKLIWGSEPSNIALECEPLFKEHNVKNILIMGAGYGRNGKYFIEKGYDVDGIEYSEEAIKLGKIFCPEINFIHASALNVSLSKKYDALFCYSILHLFREPERGKLLKNCVNHCKNEGLITLSCCSTADKTFGIGNKVEHNTYEIKKGKIMHFFAKEEIINIDESLENIRFGYSTEKISTEEREEEYNMIYGVYKIKSVGSHRF